MASVNADFRIRHMEESDFDSLYDIFGERDLLLGTMRLPYPSRESVSRRLEQSEGIVRLVAESNGVFAGFLELETFPNVPRHNHVGAIHFIATHQDFRGQGVGRILMNAAIEMADNWLRLTRLELSVWTPNKRAIGLYESCGFEIEGTLRDYVLRDGEFVDAYVMARVRR